MPASFRAEPIRDGGSRRREDARSDLTDRVTPVKAVAARIVFSRGRARPFAGRLHSFCTAVPSHLPLCVTGG